MCTTIFFVAGIHTFVKDRQQCESALDSPKKCIQFSAKEVCDELATLNIQECCRCLSTVGPVLTERLIVRIACGLPGFVLSFLAFWFGRQLHAEIKQGAVFV